MAEGYGTIRERGRLLREGGGPPWPQPALIAPPGAGSGAPVQLQAIPEPAILHVRLPDFAVTVVVAQRPELAGQPLIVGGDELGRGAVWAASPQARARGVRAGMPLRTVAGLCPQALVLPVEPSSLPASARAVLALLGVFTPLVEADPPLPAPGSGGVRPDAEIGGRRARRPPISAPQVGSAHRDGSGRSPLVQAGRWSTGRAERGSVANLRRLAGCFGAYLDVRGCERLFGPAGSMARQIEAELASYGYAAQIGIATNPDLAAVASALAAPGSPRLVEVGGEAAFLADLKLDGPDGAAALLDLDPDLVAHLRTVGFSRAGDLAAIPSTALRLRFGAAGMAAHARATGSSARPVVPPPVAATIERSRRLEDPIGDGERLARELGRLAGELAAALAVRQQAACTLTLTIRLASDEPPSGPRQLSLFSPPVPDQQPTRLGATVRSRSMGVGRAEVRRGGSPGLESGECVTARQARVSTRREPGTEGTKRTEVRAGPDMPHSPDSSPGFLERRGATKPGPVRSSGSQPQVPRPGGERSFSRTLHLKAPVAGEPALVARSGELLAQLLRQAGAEPARPLLVEGVILQAGALRAAGVQLTLPLLDLQGSGTISAVERLAQQLRARFGPRAARRVRLVADALLPEERVVWDDAGCQPPPGARIALEVQLDDWDRPASIRRGQGAWEPVQTICSQWRLRTRWWMDPTHRHYYLLETARGAVLELYRELSDGSWHLVHRRD